MTSRFASSMRRATSAVRAYNTIGATRIIQEALNRNSASVLDRWLKQQPAPTAKVPSEPPQPVLAPLAPLPGNKSERPVQEQGTFVTRSFTCSAGARRFKLFVPNHGTEAPRGLIVMLHGCTQNPDDFAAGTRMNEIAERNGLIVAYPEQTRAYNASSCWSWFQTRDQHRDKGEPAIIAGLTRQVIDEFGLDRHQVFIVGLSAGGAMAVIMAETYPDVFSAVGVHSGLPYQSATNVMSALAAMRGRVSHKVAIAKTYQSALPDVRTIIFHGSADKTVHPDNAKGIVGHSQDAQGRGEAHTEHGIANGRQFTRMVITAPDGQVILENWTIDGAGHAWSGGNPAGSFADPLGPDASSEMVRFFLYTPTQVGSQ